MEHCDILFIYSRLSADRIPVLLSLNWLRYHRFKGTIDNVGGKNIHGEHDVLYGLQSRNSVHQPHLLRIGSTMRENLPAVFQLHLDSWERLQNKAPTSS